MAFLDFLRGKCANVGVKLKVSAREGSRDGLEGYFESTYRTLAIYAGAPGWMIHAAHEAGHMDQWAEGYPDWDAANAEQFDEWLKGRRKICEPKLTELTRAIQRLELDAYRRGMATVRRFGLTNDIVHWTREANLYVMAYEFARRYRVWWSRDGIRPHDLPEVMERIPKRLISVSKIGELDGQVEHIMLDRCMVKS